ncbi:MAG: hypothetical protein ACRDTN_19210 [Mycobacterium sp.]
MTNIANDLVTRFYSYTGAAFFTIADGLIADAWVIGDLDSLRRQLR